MIGLPDDVMFQQKYVIDRLETRLQEQKELLQLMQTQKKYLLQQIEEYVLLHRHFDTVIQFYLHWIPLLLNLCQEALCVQVG